ncbi:Hypothetical_protein [Hexamita inflata]|uniref:Hypothetical_protein n=1 Tax=Hexamita inflata TaxID=28002 RepID=A0AA86QSA0_9EUKA|nr:Hypothetical protein HINF_LOCUS52761 [Hexamita inflata]
MQCTQGSLMYKLATMLNTDPADINTILCKILMLPDNTYRRLFHHLSFNGLDSSSSYHQFCCITLQYFSKGSLMLQDMNTKSQNINAEQLPSKLDSAIVSLDTKTVLKRYRNNKSEQRKETQSHVAFQTLFAQSAVSVLQSHNVSNQELCEKIDQYIANNKRAVFWKKLELLIPSKSHIQLRDYYNKSFSKCMYKEYITHEDKLILRGIMTQMPEAKPAAVVDRFIETTGSNQYFKRNLVMYVVNTKNAQQK